MKNRPETAWLVSNSDITAVNIKASCELEKNNRRNRKAELFQQQGAKLTRRVVHFPKEPISRFSVLSQIWSLNKNEERTASGTTSTGSSLNCRHFSVCPGCSLDQNLNWPPCSKLIEDYFEKHHVKVKFHSTTKIHEWRTIVRLAVRQDSRGFTKIGLFKENSHDVIEIPYCRVHHPLINEAAEIIKLAVKESGIVGYDEDRGRGHLRYIQLATSSQTVQAVFVWNASNMKESAPYSNRFLKKLKEKQWKWHSLWLNFNTTRGNRIFDLEPSRWVLYWGKLYVCERIGGVNIFFPPYAFRQSNLETFQQFVMEASKYISSRSRILEYYSGVGAISIPIAFNSRAKIIAACELNSLAEKAYLKGIYSLPSLYQRDSFKFLHGTAAAHRDKLDAADIVIVDPPRSGLDYALASRIGSISSSSSLKRILYVSCHFKSLQRDLEIIQRSKKWKIHKVEAFLFFPGTDHWEVLCVLNRSG
eukprot:jgi/Galph1/68/GphlegSOOS_G4789.1